jgi:hypothetical protein
MSIGEKLKLNKNKVRHLPPQQRRTLKARKRALGAAAISKYCGNMAKGEKVGCMRGYKNLIFLLVGITLIGIGFIPAISGIVWLSLGHWIWGALWLSISVVLTVGGTLLAGYPVLRRSAGLRE